MQPEPLLPAIETNIPLVIAFLFCFISAIMCLLFIIPLQIKQATVRNGLAKLRIQLLEIGITIFITNSIAAFFLFQVIKRTWETGTYVSTLTQILLFAFAFSKLKVATNGLRIYHQQYTPEHIEASHRVDEMMTREKSIKKG